MKKRLSNLPSPVMAGVIREKYTKNAIAQIKNCMYDGAGMIDLHMSCLEKTDIDTLKTIMKSTKLPVLALNYNRTYDWSDAGYSEEERAEEFIRAVEAGAAGIDMQSYTFHSKSREGFYGEDKYSFTRGNPKEIVTDDSIIGKQRELIDKVHALGAEVLLSCHPRIPMCCEQVVDLALYLEKNQPDIIKIVTSAESEEDLAESFKTMMVLKKEVETPVSFHTTGAAGALSRIINPLLGGHIIFCVDRYDAGSTMEQLDLRTVKTVIDNIKKMM